MQCLWLGSIMKSHLFYKYSYKNRTAEKEFSSVVVIPKDRPGKDHPKLYGIMHSMRDRQTIP